jgi:hypothetical protein
LKGIEEDQTESKGASFRRPLTTQDLTSSFGGNTITDQTYMKGESLPVEEDRPSYEFMLEFFSQDEKYADWSDEEIERWATTLFNENVTFDEFVYYHNQL